jgi:hypothetical protein
MLEPRDRLLLFEALQPPQGFRFDQGIGTTYTLDLLALLTAPMAFTLFQQQSEDKGHPAVDSLEIIESLRRHADHLTIFCHAGRIGLPKVFYPQLAFVEESIIECQPEEGGAFHPKVWVLRWINDSGDVSYRVLCLSRNLTFARAWDTLLTLNGVISTKRPPKGGLNPGLSAFVRALPRLATRRPVVASVQQRADALAGELERVEFELPDGIKEMRFWPLGVGGRTRDPLEGTGDRLLVVSPFITLGRLERLTDGRETVTLVSTPNALGCLARLPRGVSKFYTLLERATIEGDAEHEPRPESEAEAIEQSDLHAKLYISENGWDAHIWTGSANATDAAFTRNVELLVELVGPRKRFGIDALMEPQKGELRFINLLQDAGTLVAQDPKDAEIEALNERLEKLRECIAATSLEARVTSMPTDTFDIELICRSTEPLDVDTDLALRCWPVTVTSGVGASVESLAQGESFATFSGLSFQAITSFFAFELTGPAKGKPWQVRFVLNLPLLGAPEGRREQVLRSLVRDKSRMLRFLWLLLADEGVVLPDPSGPPTAGGARDANGQGLQSGGLFEILLRNLDRAPQRLDHLTNLLKELRQGADGEDLLPPGFDAIWEPIRLQRERLRPKVEA